MVVNSKGWSIINTNCALTYIASYAGIEPVWPPNAHPPCCLLCCYRCMDDYINNRHLLIFIHAMIKELGGNL